MCLYNLLVEICLRLILSLPDTLFAVFLVRLVQCSLRSRFPEALCPLVFSVRPSTPLALFVTILVGFQENTEKNAFKKYC